MRILQESVAFADILNCLKGENRESESLGWATDYLTAANNEFGGRWTLVTLSREDILNVMLPKHTHPRTNPQLLIPEPWLAVSDAAARIRERTQETGECWDNINSHKNRDFSQTHILKWQDSLLQHLDGLHRLLA
jgi:hypothetical protein